MLDRRYGLTMFDDLLNPVKTTPEATPGLFKKAGPGPVRYTPVIALGLETVNRGGWYAPASGRPDEARTLVVPVQEHDRRPGDGQEPAAAARSPARDVAFDPGDRPFGLWVSNDGLKDGGVFSEPKARRRGNARLRSSRTS